MKQMLEQIIVERQKTVFLIKEDELELEGVVEDIYSLVSLGEIPNLFIKREGRDEFSKIRDLIKEKWKREGEDQIQDIFISTIQELLHLVICV